MFKKILASLTIAAMIAVIPAMAVHGEGASSGMPEVQALPQMMDDTKAASPYTITSQDKKVAENEDLVLYLEEENLVLKVMSKESGYIWSSAVPSDATGGMSMEWIRMSQSLLTMDYISGNAVKRSAMKHGEAKKPEVTLLENGFEARVNFYEAKSFLTLRVTLEGDSVIFSVPDESIEMGEGNLLNRLLVMPFFGAVYEDTIPGYAFVPDGSGALMRFEKAKPYSSMYNQRIYGSDRSASQSTLGTKQPTVASLYGIQVPVFGMVHGNQQNAFAGIITNGAEYCEIMANPAGNIVDYTWQCPAFVYNEQYWQPTGRTTGFYANQTEQNQVNLTVEYRFLSGEEADYVGMANAYKEFLIQENPALVRRENGEIGVKVDAFMAEPKKALIGKKLKVVTTIKDVTGWVNELTELGVSNLEVALVGYEKDGRNGHKINEYSLDKKAGSQKALAGLSEQLDGKLCLQTNVVTGYDNQLAKKYVKTGMSGNILTETENQPVFDTRVWATEESIRQSVDSLEKNAPIDGISLEGFTGELSGDYKRSSSVSRQQAMEQRMELLGQLAENGKRIALENPNFWAMTAGEIGYVYNLSSENSRFGYFTDTVPFLQIVLSGYVDMYSSYQNFNSNTMEDLLKLIDYNMYPSYLLTEMDSSELSNSNMSYLYSSKFDTWKEDVASHYTEANELLSQVTGAGILHRYVPQDGVSVTEYENGVTIAVNYLDEDVVVNGETVPGLSAGVLKKGGN